MANNLMDKPEIQAVHVIRLGQTLKEIHSNIKYHGR